MQHLYAPWRESYLKEKIRVVSFVKFLKTLQKIQKTECFIEIAISLW